MSMLLSIDDSMSLSDNNLLQKQHNDPSNDFLPFSKSQNSSMTSLGSRKGDSNPVSPRNSMKERKSIMDGLLELSRVGSGEFLVRNLSRKSSRSGISMMSDLEQPIELIDQNEEKQGLSKESKNLLLALILSSLFIFSANSIFSPNLTVMAKEFGFDDKQRDKKLGRDLNTVFLLLSCPMTLLVSYLSDSVNRKWIYYFNTVLASGAGVAVGSQLPILYSLFGDIYPPEARIRGSALASSLYAVGVAVGQVFGAFLGPLVGWRYSMLAISIPPLLTLIYIYFVQFPVRGCTEKANVVLDTTEVNSFLSLKDLAGLFLIPTNLLLFLQGIPGSMPLGMIAVYLFDFLKTDKGLGLMEATALTALVGMGALLGTYVGGLLGQVIYLYKKFLLPFYMGGSLLAAVPLLCVFYTFEYKVITWYLWVGYVLFLLLSCSLLNIMGSNIRAILLNVNLPETRSSVICIAQIMNNIGNTLGPVVFAAFLNYGRQVSFQIVSLFWILSGLLVFCVAKFLSKDESKKQEILINRANSIGVPLLLNQDS